MTTITIEKLPNLELYWPDPEDEGHYLLWFADGDVECIYLDWDHLNPNSEWHSFTGDFIKGRPDTRVLFFAKLEDSDNGNNS